MSAVHRPHRRSNERNHTDGAGPGPANDGLGGFEERLLAELKVVVAQRGAAATGPRAGRRARRSRPPRPLLLAGAVSAALAAGLAVVLAVTPGTARPPAGGTSGALAPAATATAVLRNAALAALAQPAATPQPGQFVYSKVYTDETSWPKPEVEQTWLSVSGTRAGLRSQAGGAFPGTYPEQGCRNGQVFPLPHLPKITARKYPARLHLSCTPADLAAYLPSMPTRPAALRAWLDRRNDLRPGPAGAIDLLWATGDMLTTDYLTPGQRAAAYEVLAQTPGLKIVPQAATLLGRAGVGVRWTLRAGRAANNPYTTYTLVFNRKTYQLLGMNWTGRPRRGGATGGEALIKLAIVSKAGSQP